MERALPEVATAGQDKNGASLWQNAEVQHPVNPVILSKGSLLDPL
jgi:hypothetical protein